MKLEKTFGKLSSAQISELENQLNISLPDDYKNFLAEINGGVIDLNTDFLIHIDDINESASVDVLFGLTPQASHTDLLSWNKTYGYDMLPDSIIIAQVLKAVSSYSSAMKRTLEYIIGIIPTISSNQTMSTTHILLLTHSRIS
ncbi:SMI1/KNR4 family protein [Feifania hominis]|uniref:SMI1/KNR4 family protein n=1 Tax=Feifania hominis TaxID=2763660 RepID=A0A926HR82_9FIRM|nr:SMI1/KNR4 family protein [Feifania hominis]MBC8537137.1 SMI1/KNR4 family protein [Feifania hominis]